MQSKHCLLNRYDGLSDAELKLKLSSVRTKNMVAKINQPKEKHANSWNNQRVKTPTSSNKRWFFHHNKNNYHLGITRQINQLITYFIYKSIKCQLIGFDSPT